MEAQQIKIKPCRAKNFSSEEESELVSLVEKYKHLIENKKFDAVTWREKEQTWDKLASLFVSRTGVQRTSKALKEKYDNLKRRSKAELAEEKRETYRNGGGPPANNFVSNVSERIIGLIGESATGLESFFDSDALDKEIVNPFTEIHEVATNGIVGATSEADEAKLSESFKGKWNPYQLKQPVAKKLARSKVNKSLAQEKQLLVETQQIFFEKENARAEEKHNQEMKMLQEKHQNELENFELKKKNFFCWKLQRKNCALKRNKRAEKSVKTPSIKCSCL